MPRSKRTLTSFSATWPSSLCTGLHLFHRQSTQDSVASISFPYTVSPEDLPESLPTIDQIAKSEEVFVERGGGKVVAVGPHFVVKYGGGIDLEEGRTMIFVRENTSVPVPRVYALFTDAISKKSYIIMERIHGKTLKLEWPLLNESEKKMIAAQIREHICTLRKLRSRSFCSIANKPLRAGLFWTANELPNWNGPFDSESALHNAIVEIYKLSLSAVVRQKADHCQNVILPELRHYKPVFTHGDLQRKNLMIHVDSELKKRVVIIDWESAGFYPEYWEYARAYLSARFRDDWETYLQEILAPCTFIRECYTIRVVFDDLFA